MAKIKCFHCGHVWALGQATTNRCPQCSWIIEIYYDAAEADQVAKIYNADLPPHLISSPSGVLPLEGINGYAVAFPDQGHLACIAGQLLGLK